jgi:hypothetical protein
MRVGNSSTENAAIGPWTMAAEITRIPRIRSVIGQLIAALFTSAGFAVHGGVGWKSFRVSGDVKRV